jgi:phosphate transport system protein
MRLSFQGELSQLESTLLEEGELVRRGLRGAMKALVEGDLELAGEVIEFDDEIDRQYVAIEHGIESLLARQTPVAVDLRLVLAMLHVNLHLERMADYCVTIAKHVKLAEGLGGEPRMLEAFEEMGERAEEMLRVALNSFSARNVARAESLVELDELIDRANRKVVEQVLNLGSDPALREWGLRMLMVSRCLERIGDHAVDIGEQTAYLVTAEFREFTDASDATPRPLS